MILPESEVLEKLNIVSTAKRLANMVSIVWYVTANGYVHAHGL